MDINVTLLVEIVTFIILVWITMKYIWPPILKAIEDRQKMIADGLAASERGERALELARKKAKENLLKTKEEAANIIANANRRAAQVIEMAKEAAEKENEKFLIVAKEEIAAEAEKVKRQLRMQTTDLVIDVCQKILGKNVDAKINKELVDKFIDEV